MKTDTAAPAAPKSNKSHQSLFFTMPSAVDIMSPLGAQYKTVAQTYGGNYKATIEEAIAVANQQSSVGAKSGGAGIVYVLGVVAVVRPKEPIVPSTIVERFDLPCSK